MQDNLYFHSKEDAQAFLTELTHIYPDNNKISDESPVGAGLVGKKVGEAAEITLPNGGTMRFKVLSIERS